jgi:hypothetical protein
MLSLLFLGLYCFKQAFLYILINLVSQRQLEQIPELIILTNSRSFENLKLKRKEKKRRKEHIIYNKYNMCAR